MKSNEDVDWGVIFREASACVQHRHVFEQKQGEWYMYETLTVYRTGTHSFRNAHAHTQDDEWRV